MGVWLARRGHFALWSERLGARHRHRGRADTSRGPGLLKALSAAGVVLDTTHLADQAFGKRWTSLRYIIASHNNCRAIVPGQGQFTDEQLKAIIDRRRVIGVALDTWMLYPDFAAGRTPNTLVSLEDVLDHIDHICRLAGNNRYVGIGSDLDGEFGFEKTPRELNTIEDLQKVPALLERRGYHRT